MAQILSLWVEGLSHILHLHFSQFRLVPGYPTISNSLSPQSGSSLILPATIVHPNTPLLQLLMKASSPKGPMHLLPWDTANSS